MTEPADRYGVVGHPVAHSWSPFIHGMFARATGQLMSYRLYDITSEEFSQRVPAFFAEGGSGLNVTVPHKVAAAELCTELTPRAANAGAVNTLMRTPQGALLGDNTDGAGLVRDLCDNQQVTVTHRRVLLIGAGGASRGVLGPLLALDPTEMVIANRSAERARGLAAAFAHFGNVVGAGFAYVSGGPFDIVINATSAGLSGEMPPIPVGVVGSHTICYDMSYGRSETPFLRWAQELGCARTVQGLGMLVEQAAESFRLWRGVRPETAPVLAALAARMHGT